MHTYAKHPATRRLCRGLVASLLISPWALPSFAQSQPAAEPDRTGASGSDSELVVLEKFTVTGAFMGSLVAAAEGKQASARITEIIAAEDIGKLPDVSIAEAIARLPGLAAQRVGGRAQVISMRGLAPDFATTLLNGREQVSTGDNRAVEFDQYPSELIGSVAVYKTPDASLVGQGLSGTLDLQTVKPFSFAHRTVAMNARYEMNSLGSLGSDSEDTGYRLSATYIDQFANRTVGVAFGYAHLDSPIASAEYGTYGWNTNSRPGVPAGTYATDGLKVFARSGTNTRDGLVGIVEWRPSDAFTSVIDAYYSKFRHEETNRGLEAHIGGYNGGNNPGLDYTAATVANNTLVGGVATGIYPLARNIYNKRTDELTALGWHGEYRPGDWIFAGDVSYSKAEREELNLETQAQYRGTDGNAVLDTITYDLTGGHFPTIDGTLDYADPARIQVGPTIYGAGYGKVPQIKDELTSYRLAVVRKLTKVLESIEFGANYADRSKDKAQPEASLSAGNWRPINADLLLRDTDLGFANGPSTLSWSVPAIMASSYDPFVPSSTAYAYLIQKTWRVDEKIATYYAQLNLDVPLGSLGKLRGNIGLQLKDVDQSSTSNYFDNAAPSGQQVKVNRDGKTYTNVLPSANLVFDFNGLFVLRASGAKQVARPRLDQLKSAFEFNIDSSSGLPSGSGGNPHLDPWKATAADVSLEKYFGNHAGYIALSGFYKKLDTYIFDQTDPNYDFSRFTAGSPVPVLTNFGRFTQPLNGKGGSLKGLEFTVSLPFQLLSKSLEGFGLIASAARNSSSITVDNTNLGSTIMLPGLSKTVTNLTLYFERKGFSTRVSRRYRSDFIGEITGFGADRELRYVKGEAVIDAQIGYEFQSGRLKGLGLFVQAYNIGDAKYQTYQVEKERVVETQRYGRTILSGVSYKF
ncbi:MAG TPA: TonB-dependent receptor [Opitutaceae bacterium]|nr:TonB-dependent receptor [Opitutaceae bacterium]